ncbi:MAG: tetratricopeptide repeat protein [Nitrospirota bacterium]
MQRGIIFIIAVFSLLLFLPEVSFSQSIDEIIKKADELQNIVSADAEHEALIKMLKEAAAKNPNSFDLQWRTARALGIWADQINMRNTLDNAKKANPKNVDGILATEKDMSPELGKKVSALGGEARGYAEKAISLNPNRVEGYYYNSLALSMYSLGKGIISALAEGIRPKLVETAKKAIERDKTYNEGSPLRVYGRYYYKVPWPYNDKTESVKILREAVQVYPNSLRTLLYLGDTLYALGKRDEAKRQWEKIMKTSASAFEKVLEDVFKGMAGMRLERISN